MQSNSEIDLKFTDHVTKHLDEGKDHELFTHGCCFHFALCLYRERKIPTIDGCVINHHVSEFFHQQSYTHVWLVIGSRAFDVRGVNDRKVFSDTVLKNYSSQKTLENIDPAIVQKYINQHVLPSSVLERLNKRILQIFDYEERFEEIRILRQK